MSAIPSKFQFVRRLTYHRDKNRTWNQLLFLTFYLYQSAQFTIATIQRSTFDCMWNLWFYRTSYDERCVSWRTKCAHFILSDRFHSKKNNIFFYETKWVFPTCVWGSSPASDNHNPFDFSRHCNRTTVFWLFEQWTSTRTERRFSHALNKSPDTHSQSWNSSIHWMCPFH